MSNTVHTPMLLVLVHSENFDKYRDLVQEFGRTFYQEAFPLDNEREDMEDICHRVCSTQNDNRPSSFIVLAQTHSGELVGGLIADWYPSCASLELIYITIGKNYRHKGYGKRLMLDGVRMICSFLPVTVKVVYLETENPELVATSNSVIDPFDRLRFFDKCGVRRVPIRYVQPPLAVNKGFIGHLFLCVFPLSGETKIESKDLISFIKSFYDGLEGECHPKKMLQFKSELIQMTRQINQLADDQLFVPLSRMVEKPRYLFYGFTLTAHFAVTHCSRIIQEKENSHCITFHSYESDLFNYSHQQTPPFQTHHLDLLEDAELVFPDFYRYSSEGQKHFRICDSKRKSVKVDLSVNWSVKKRNDSYDRIVHLTFTPHTGRNDTSFLTELEIIKLVAGLHFGSLQEDFHSAEVENDSFLIKHKSINNEQPIPLRSIPKYILNDPTLTLSPSHTGITEIDVSRVVSIDDASKQLKKPVLSCMSIPKNLSSKKNGVIPSFSDYLQQVDRGELDESDWNKTLCGIILGIFDFNRMNSPEIYDTIRPLFKRKELFSILSRGHMLEIYSGESSFERVENTYVSPYLLIPSTALLYNELLLSRIRDKLSDLSLLIKEDKFWQKDRTSIWTSTYTFFSLSDIKKVNAQIRIATECQNSVSRSLNEDYMTQIFQYQSEKDFLERGLSGRGMCSKVQRIRESLDILSNYIKELRQSNEDYRSNRVNVLLFLFAVLQVLIALLSEDIPKWPILIVSIIGFILIIHYYDYLQKEKR